MLLKTDLLTVIFIKYMQLYLNKTGAVQSYIYYHLYQKNEIPILTSKKKDDTNCWSYTLHGTSVVRRSCNGVANFSL